MNGATIEMVQSRVASALSVPHAYNLICVVIVSLIHIPVSGLLGRLMMRTL